MSEDKIVTKGIPVLQAIITRADGTTEELLLEDVTVEDLELKDL